MSKDVNWYATDDGMEVQLRRLEIDSLNRYLKSSYRNKEGASPGSGNGTGAPSN
jgi:hypothetical protein